MSAPVFWGLLAFWVAVSVWRTVTKLRWFLKITRPLFRPDGSLVPWTDWCGTDDRTRKALKLRLDLERLLARSTESGAPRCMRALGWIGVFGGLIFVMALWPFEIVQKLWAMRSEGRDFWHK